MEKDFEQIAEFLHEALELAKSVQSSHGKLLKDFNKCVADPPTACSGNCRRPLLSLILQFLHLDVQFSDLQQSVDTGLLVLGTLMYTDSACCHICRGLDNNAELADLRKRVEEFAGAFAMPGFDVSAIKQSPPAANGVAH